MEKYYSTLSTIAHDCQHPLLFQTKIQTIIKATSLFYGLAEKFLTDKGEEFANKNFTVM